MRNLKTAAGSMSKKQILKGMQTQEQRMDHLNKMIEAHARDCDKVIQFLLLNRKEDVELPDGMLHFCDNLHNSVKIFDKKATA